MIKAAIAGGTGYTGGELFRILLNHPEVKITAATTTSSEGVLVSDVHRDLLGMTDLRFGGEVGDADVLFLCLGHGVSREFIDTHDIPTDCRIIDLGNDFRLDGSYKGRDFIYGLCEGAKGRTSSVSAHDIANPGCFATAIQLALIPLADAGLISDDVHVTAITGATGAGKKLSETTHFSNRNDNISIYKNFTHQHLAEIRQNAARYMGSEPKVNFVPMRGDFARGIFASVYTKAAEGYTEDQYCELYEEFYKGSSFVFPSRKPIFMKDVVNTNNAQLHIELHEGYVHIASAIDNLVKGASGQAVQNMNLMFGLPETMGLRLKANAF
ncbi:MAG: N-acetyl-gamma-glutamyl-phosphate reductase [Bacteroidales bacterium]|nr:N-acetyl-gamma-glutamyl-phosphate reductase [Bacteroidales bacterium]